MGYQSTNGLMRHLRSNGIAISGSTQKKQLINTGYYHGYKGYRFFGTASTRLPFNKYSDIYATIQYDSKLKALLYGRIMYIETAFKNIALDSILDFTKSESIQAMLDKAICSYNKSPASFNPKQKKKSQQNKLKLSVMIHSALSRAYQDENPQITHFYNNVNYSGVPLWALFEILTMGDFGFLLSCLQTDVRKKISLALGLGTPVDTDYHLIYKYTYLLKDLRNAIAHNAVVFDARFRKFDPNAAMLSFLKTEVGLPFVNFKSIGDYVILISFFLKQLGLPKTEIKAFIRDFEKITNDYISSVDLSISSIAVRSDLNARLAILKSYI